MSEPMCICGHGKQDHVKTIREDGKEEWCRKCGCDLYRPILPWPDAEGWWVRESDGEHLKAMKSENGEIAVWFSGCWELKNDYRIDRFCRCEPNPFAKGRE